MKKLTQLLFALFMIIGTAELYAQSKNILNNSRTRFLQQENEAFEHTSGKNSAPNFQNTTVYVPVNEIDSTYDPGTSTWSYTWDVHHTYYQSSCLDSVVTYSYFGTNMFRETHQYDLNGFEIYELTENWNGFSWDNSSLYLNEYDLAGCYSLHFYALEWNGANWDTLYGSRNSINYDVNNNPIQRITETYQNGIWVNSSRNIYSYDLNNQLTEIEHSVWDTPGSQFILQWRSTNYSYYFYNNYCHYYNHTRDLQFWNGSSWYDSLRYVFTNGNNYDSTLILTWNGSAYDSTSIQIFGVDNFGNNLGFIEYTYDLISQSWIISSVNQYLLSYGPNDEVIRRENINDWYSTPDSIFPDNVAIYTNFIMCNSTLSVDEKSVGPGVNVYPNPVKDKLHVELTSNDKLGNVFFSIVSITGQTIKFIQISNQNTDVELNHIVPGIYFYQVRDDKSILKNGKIIVE